MFWQTDREVNVDWRNTPLKIAKGCTMFQKKTIMKCISIPRLWKVFSSLVISFVHVMQLQHLGARRGGKWEGELGWSELSVCVLKDWRTSQHMTSQQSSADINPVASKYLSRDDDGKRVLLLQFDWCFWHCQDSEYIQTAAMAWQEAIEIAKCEDGWKEEKCDKKTVGKHYRMT